MTYMEQKWEMWRITERKDGAVFQTVKVCEFWMPFEGSPAVIRGMEDKVRFQVTNDTRMVK